MFKILQITWYGTSGCSIGSSLKTLKDFFQQMVSMWEEMTVSKLDDFFLNHKYY